MAALGLLFLYFPHWTLIKLNSFAKKCVFQIIPLTCTNTSFGIKNQEEQETGLDRAAQKSADIKGTSTINKTTWDLKHDKRRHIVESVLLLLESILKGFKKTNNKKTTENKK